MTYLEMQQEVRRTLGNIQDNSIFVTSGDVGRWVNRAMQRVIRLAVGKNRHAMNIFERLHTSWQATTVSTAGLTGHLDLPADKIAVSSMFQFEKTSADRRLDRAIPVRFFPYERFIVLSKDNRSDWPRIWTQRESKVYYAPVTDVDTVTDVLLVGMMEEPALVNDADTPLAPDEWHDIYVTEAIAIGARARGWLKEAKEFRTQAREEIATSIDPQALEYLSEQQSLSVEGAPTRETVYR